VSRLLIPLAKLIWTTEGVFFRTRGQSAPINLTLCSVLELFRSNHTAETAYEAYRASNNERATETADLGHFLTTHINGIGVAMVGPSLIFCRESRVDEAYRVASLRNKSAYVKDLPSIKLILETATRAGMVDVSELREQSVFRMLSKHYGFSSTFSSALPLDSFLRLVDELETLGLLTVEPMTVNFGDLKRYTPFCPNYGYSRGTPIDRYYLDRFIRDVRSQIVGTTLEIGGHPANRETYKLESVTEYCTMDLQQKSGAHLLGDVHSKRAFGSRSFNSVILFNVLEHCARPWIVAENIHRWLKPEGKVFCMVPNAQRIHRDPLDCWRILPDAFAIIFGGYSESTITSYGNLLTTIAAMSGIAAEELDEKDLAEKNNEYPVISCVVARK
jgi:Methyltransferase domain